MTDTDNNSAKAPRGVRLAVVLAAFVVVALAVGVVAHNGIGTRAQAGRKSSATPGPTPTPTLISYDPAVIPYDPWVPVKSDAPADILAAMQSAIGYMTPPELAGLSGDVAYSFDAPVLVVPATAGGDADYYNLPHLIILGSVAGVRQITYDVIYDKNYQRLRLSSVGQVFSNDPHYGKPFPWSGLTADAAVARLQATRGLSLASGTTPELVFFQQPEPGTIDAEKTKNWTGGGMSPADPMWRIEGSDGQYHFIGTDGNEYEPNQLPVADGVTVVRP